MQSSPHHRGLFFFFSIITAFTVLFQGCKGTSKPGRPCLTHQPGTCSHPQGDARCPGAGAVPLPPAARLPAGAVGQDRLPAPALLAPRGAMTLGMRIAKPSTHTHSTQFFLPVWKTDRAIQWVSQKCRPVTFAWRENCVFLLEFAAVLGVSPEGPHKQG